MLFLKKRRQTIDLAPYMRRIIDLTTPNLPSQGNVGRTENRYNRSIPVLVTGWTEKGDVTKPVTFGVTKDLTDKGISVILFGELELSHVMVGFWLSAQHAETPLFCLGHCLRQQAIGGGFNLWAIELYEFATETYASKIQKIMPLANQLLPPDKPTAPNVASVLPTYGTR